ncbi:hypothetical protein AAKU55_000780 [Oxalobacteraceae bacterium GrIS 1.11]
MSRSRRFLETALPIRRRRFQRTKRSAEKPGVVVAPVSNCRILQIFQVDWRRAMPSSCLVCGHEYPTKYPYIQSNLLAPPRAGGVVARAVLFRPCLVEQCQALKHVDGAGSSVLRPGWIATAHRPVPLAGTRPALLVKSVVSRGRKRWIWPDGKRWAPVSGTRCLLKTGLQRLRHGRYSPRPDRATLVYRKGCPGVWRRRKV